MTAALDLHRHRAEAIAFHFSAARRQLRLARIYARDINSSGRIEAECVAKAMKHRREIKRLRGM